MKKDKSLIVGLVICFVAVIALAGLVTFRKSEKQPDEKLAQTEEKEEENEEPTEVTQGDDVQSEIVIPSPTIDPVKEQTPKFSFSEAETLLWPIDGNVLMNYSMDQTVYFATLDQYKYNPAVIIGGVEGQDVVAAQDGKVVKIETSVETGTTITIDMGDGYQAIYGQLSDVRISKGDTVLQGDLIGSLAKPTRYYSVEGCNLYFQLLKNGTPVNPLNYLEE